MKTSYTGKNGSQMILMNKQHNENIIETKFEDINSDNFNLEKNGHKINFTGGYSDSKNNHAWKIKPFSFGKIKLYNCFSKILLDIKNESPVKVIVRIGEEIASYIPSNESKRIVLSNVLDENIVITIHNLSIPSDDTGEVILEKFSYYFD